MIATGAPRPLPHFYYYYYCYYYYYYYYYHCYKLLRKCFASPPTTLSTSSALPLQHTAVDHRTQW